MNISKDDLYLAANTIRGLAMDSVTAADSGHPGMPLGCAEIAAVLWLKIMNYNPDQPAWANRDRFVLSAGHGSALLYSVLHLAGYNIGIDDLRNFRRLGSKTPGHPEYGHTPGVETTTGSLGQGFANAVGMAAAAKMLAENFNSEKELISHYVYVLAGDGDLMEGISHEAASLAGHWGLGNLICVYDSNSISIEGDTSIAESGDTAKRFESCGWHVRDVDGHDVASIEEAVLAARSVKDRPSIIIARTKIAKGSPKEGSAESHGTPFKKDEVAATKRAIGLPEDKEFYAGDDVYAMFKKRSAELKALYEDWNNDFKKTVTGDKLELWKKFFETDTASLAGQMPDWSGTKEIATRSAGGKVLEALFKSLPNIIGGSADLAPSTKTFVKGFSESGRGALGRNIHFGIREHAMAAIQNGAACYGGFIPYCSTFFVFMDYMRPSIRIAAISGLKVIYVFTHDSFFVGEDGPTHEPVEHLAAARAVPNLNVIRPADANETNEAWLSALNFNGPSLICLSRQDLPVIKSGGAAGLHRGAYIVRDCDAAPDITILASGSEVSASISAASILESSRIKARVVSFPSWLLFEAQDEKYRASVLQPGGKFAVVEAGRAMGWERYAGAGALFITLEHFGASAPASELAERFGFTPEKIAARIIEYLK
ncbi:MAG: transketolase [Leptospirales bacterium]|nr:transketolase [Leptospirales bacterium]